MEQEREFLKIQASTTSLASKFLKNSILMNEKTMDQMVVDPKQAIQLCRVTENGKIFLNRYALECISKIRRKVAVLAIAGPYRTGKSFLLNRIAGKQTGFKLGSTTNPCTEGLWMWGKPITISEDMDLILIDSEGLSM